MMFKKYVFYQLAILCCTAYITIASSVEYGDPNISTTPADQQPTPNRSLPTKNYSLEESDAPILDSFSETTEPINDPAVVKKKSSGYYDK